MKSIIGGACGVGLVFVWGLASAAPVKPPNDQIEVTEHGAFLLNGEKISCKELNIRLQKMGAYNGANHTPIKCGLPWWAYGYDTNSPQLDSTANYVSRDFSPLIVPKTVFLGFIGPEYQRLRIRFASLSQDKLNRGLYHLIGTSEVMGNCCDFEGTITVERITRLLIMHYGVDEEYKAKRLQAEGILTARYEFRENPAQKHSGVFSGIMTLSWYVDHGGKLRYDDIQIDSDGYSNNQYVGTWTAYGTQSKPKKANWGEYEIPDSGDLEGGIAEFRPNPKYLKNGWDGYQPGQ